MDAWENAKCTKMVPRMLFQNDTQVAAAGDLGSQARNRYHLTFVSPLHSRLSYTTNVSHANVRMPVPDHGQVTLLLPTKPAMVCALKTRQPQPSTLKALALKPARPCAQQNDQQRLGANHHPSLQPHGGSTGAAGPWAAMAWACGLADGLVGPLQGWPTARQGVCGGFSCETADVRF